MLKVECEANKYVASVLIDIYPWVINAIAPSEEEERKELEEKNKRNK